MINKKIIIRISNELGNQMFMYASALGISKKLDNTLLIEMKLHIYPKKILANMGLIILKLLQK